MQSSDTPDPDTPADRELLGFLPQQAVFVGFDSDGCVLDTMAVKQRNHFHPLLVRCWGLEDVEPVVREVAEFVTLSSRWRGANRFVALLKIFELLAEHPEMRRRGIRVPPTDSLQRYLRSGLPLGHPSLTAELACAPDPELRRVLEWSQAVNQDIDTRMPLPAPFPGAAEALRQVRRHADTAVLSQTPRHTLIKEWTHHGLDACVRLFVGQEAGSKTEQLRMIAGGKYGAGRVLMVGDAPGDLVAARETGAWFFPILPNQEASSWALFNGEAFDRFRQGSFDTSYQQQLLEPFQALLPDTPPWQPSAQTTQGGLPAATPSGSGSLSDGYRQA